MGVIDLLQPQAGGSSEDDPVAEVVQPAGGSPDDVPVVATWQQPAGGFVDDIVSLSVDDVFPSHGRAVDIKDVLARQLPASAPTIVMVNTDVAVQVERMHAAARTIQAASRRQWGSAREQQPEPLQTEPPQLAESLAAIAEQYAEASADVHAKSPLPSPTRSALEEEQLSAAVG